MTALNCPCTGKCTCTWELNQPAKTTIQNIADRSDLLRQAILVPRDSKLLARKTIADRATDADDCRRLLDMLGVLDLETLPEPRDG